MADGVRLLQKLQRGDCAVFQVHLGGPVDAEHRGSPAHLASARAALQGARMSAWFFRARTHDGLVDPYAEPDKPDAEEAGGDGPGGGQEEEEGAEEDDDEEDEDEEDEEMDVD